MEVFSIFTWHLTPVAQSHYGVQEVVASENSTAIKATTIDLGDTVTLTIINICWLKTNTISAYYAIHSD